MSDPVRHVSIATTLVVQGPVLSKSTSSGRPGLDAPMARSGGRYYLPYSLVRGRLREALEELVGAGAKGINEGDVVAWFGPRDRGRTGGGGSFDRTNLNPPPGGPAGYIPERGLLRFCDFACKTDPEHPPVRIRIKLDDERGAVDEGMFQVIECPFAAGEAVAFEGRIEFFADAASEARLRDWLALGLRWTPSLGSGRTFGFGRLRSVALAESTSHGYQPASAPASAAKALGLVLRFGEPFCVAKYAPAGNLFESDDVLSGGVVRGAIASVLKALAGKQPWEQADVSQLSPPGFENLARHFDEVRSTHAVPASDNGAPLVLNVRIPLSVVTATRRVHEGTVEESDEILWTDVALLEGATLLGNPPRAPAFAIDWKEKQEKAVGKDFPWAHLKKELRVRTEIDAASRRARDAQLFAYEMIVPEDHAWLATIDLSRIVDDTVRARVEAEVRGLLAGPLPGIGKTKARARAEVVEAKAIQPSHRSSPATARGDRDDGHRIVTLQTPALLCGDPWLLNETSDENALHASYQQTWTEISKGSLELVRYFARQRLVGGYLVLRHRPGKPYNPFLVTEPGSVFVLKRVSGKETEADGHLDRWLEQGLDLPPWACHLYGDDWKTCPFRPQDGFGEIALDLDCHRDPNHAPGGNRS